MQMMVKKWDELIHFHIPVSNSHRLLCLNWIKLTALMEWDLLHDRLKNREKRKLNFNIINLLDLQLLMKLLSEHNELNHILLKEKIEKQISIILMICNLSLHLILKKVKVIHILIEKAYLIDLIKIRRN